METLRLTASSVSRLHVNEGLAQWLNISGRKTKMPTGLPAFQPPQKRLFDSSNDTVPCFGWASGVLEFVVVDVAGFFGRRQRTNA